MSIPSSQMQWRSFNQLWNMSRTVKMTKQGIPVMLYVGQDYKRGQDEGSVYAIPLGVFMTARSIDYTYNCQERSDGWEEDFEVELDLEDAGEAGRTLMPTMRKVRGESDCYDHFPKLIQLANTANLESLDFHVRYKLSLEDSDAELLGMGKAFKLRINIYANGKLVKFDLNHPTFTNEEPYLMPSILGTVKNLTSDSFQIEFPEITGGGVVTLPLSVPLFPRYVSPVVQPVGNEIRAQPIANRGHVAAHLRYTQPNFNAVKVINKPTLWKAVLTQCLFETPETRAEFALRAAIYSMHDRCAGDMTGLGRVKKYITAVKEHDELVGLFLHCLTGRKKVDGVSRNQVILGQIEATPDPKDFCKMIRIMAQDKLKIVKFADQDDYEEQCFEFVSEFKSFDEVQQRKHEKEVKAQADAKALKARSLIEKVDGMAIMESKYPRLHAELVSGAIPVQVFSQPKLKGSVLPDQPVNRELVLWEEALSQPGWRDAVVSVATNAGNRKTYDRDVTPWLNFMLNMLPAYLDKHAPRPDGGKWKCQPVHVQGAWELERDTETNENGTSKRRSAMTPVADNDTGVVTVPYVAMVVPGFQDQYCYSKHYYVFTKGMTDPESGGIVLHDLEEKLNGRDDYGLMYYDLNGTVTAQGYPTFLIIFERKRSGTHVHFHRVRPCRSANGVKTPAMELVAACYQYMAGNIPAEAVVAQQGDLILINAKNDPVLNNAKMGEAELGGSNATSGFVFESHRFVGKKMCFFSSKTKEPNNRLGYVYAPHGVYLDHPEHDNTDMLPAGWYEVRRAKTWEANPRGIWRGFSD